MESAVETAGRQGPSWGRALLLALPAWWTVASLAAARPWCFVDFVNLAFHEAGHLFFTPFGSTAHYLGGTLGQLGVPAALAAYFVVIRREPFAAALCAWWVGESLVNVAVYMADARELALPLVGGGDHDWNELFFRFGALDADSVAAVAGATRLAGAAGMVLGLAWGAFFVLPPARRALWISDALLRRPWLAAVLGD